MKNTIYIKQIAILLMVLVITLPISFASQSLSYDANGNLVTGDGYYREYNDFNQMNKIRNGENASAPLMEEYFYDHEGIRKATLKYNSTGYNYEKTYTPFREYMQIENNSGTYNFTYVYQGDVLVARKNPDGSKFYYHPDSLGSTSLITDNTGNVVERTFYNAYGELQSSPSAEKRVGYTGHELDEDTGQVYMKARFYKPSQGQFVQPDTIIKDVYNPQNLNRYAYARNSPYKYIDPTGHVIFDIVKSSAISLGGAALTIAAGVGLIATAPILGSVAVVAGMISASFAIAGLIYGGLSNPKDNFDNSADLAAAKTSDLGAVITSTLLNPDDNVEKQIEKLKIGSDINDIMMQAIFGIPKTATDILGLGYTSFSIISRHLSQTQFIQQQEQKRQEIVKQRNEGSYSGGGGYNPGAGAYITPDGHVYPTTNPNWQPCGCATNGGGTSGT